MMSLASRALCGRAGPGSGSISGSSSSSGSEPIDLITGSDVEVTQDDRTGEIMAVRASRLEAP